MTIKSNDIDVLDSAIKKGEEETKVKIIDQHGDATPEGFNDAMDEALAKDEDKVSEETTEVVDDVDTDEEIVEEEVVESEDDTTDDSEESKTEVKTEVETTVETEKVVETKVEPQRKTDDVVREEPEELKFELDPELVDPQVKAAIDSMAATLNKQQKDIAEEREGLRLEREKAFETRVDSCFDSYEKDLPRIGNSSKLTKESGEYRKFILAERN